jgi:hypothetical protein
MPFGRQLFEGLQIYAKDLHVKGLNSFSFGRRMPAVDGQISTT